MKSSPVFGIKYTDDEDDDDDEEDDENEDEDEEVDEEEAEEAADVSSFLCFLRSCTAAASSISMS
jgi:hypothetical protein